MVAKIYNIVNKTNNTHGYDLLDENLFAARGALVPFPRTSPVDKQNKKAELSLGGQLTDASKGALKQPASDRGLCWE